ncbi:MAG: ATP-binding protein [Leucobacter sp.]
MEASPLFRTREDRVFAGVCAGLAEHLRVSVVAVRVAMGVFTLFGGAGIIFYLWLWATVPLEGETESVLPLRRALTKPAEWLHTERGTERTSGADPTRPAERANTAEHAEHSDRQVGQQRSGFRESRPRVTAVFSSKWPIAEILLGGCLLAAGVALVLARFGVQIRLEVVLPALSVLVGVGLTWWQITDRNRPDRNQLPRLLGALALVAVGVLMFFVTASNPNAWTVIAAALAVLAGVALALAPLLLRLNRELSAERAARAREAERSDIAAHLHDSVLQTLAMIQQRSGPGSDVARLARAQERELREWLFRSADGAETPTRPTLDVELGAHAAAIEEDHQVRFEVVVVGGQVGGNTPTGAPELIVLAAREAMLNAARHAGGEVAVYAEVTPKHVLIDVLDRGPGFDPDALPENRMGVRESILGRMERGGGTAKITPGPGGTGVAVRLSVPHAVERTDAVHAGERPRRDTQ